VVGVAADGEEAARLVGELEPDAVILDVRMPPSYTDEGLQAAKEIRSRHPGVAVLVLSQYVETACVAQLMSEGGRGIGYLLKDRVSDLAEVVDALRRVAAGGCVVDGEVVTRLLDRRRQASELDELTERERQVLELMTQGRTNHAIAALLFLSEKTVEAHVRRIFTKLGLAPSGDDHRRVLAVLRYLRSTAPASP
jgi:serine/threonine-protein kinase